ncbi:MAG: co-chaperone GroES [Planctomycetia bacterium]
MPSIKPLNDKVLIERLEAVDKTAGGILLPDTAKEKPTEGRVVAVGDGRFDDQGKRVPLSVKAGDRVLFSAYAGTQVKEGGKEYLILEESEVLAILDDAPWPSGGKKK